MKTYKIIRAEIKAKIKQLGYKLNKDFTVSVGSAGCNTRILLKCKNPELTLEDLQKVEAMAEAYDKGEYDEANQQRSLGGSTFVSVESFQGYRAQWSLQKTL